MKKQVFIDMGLQSGLTLSQIESVLLRVLRISTTQLFHLENISSIHIYEIQKYFYALVSGKPQEYILETANFYGRDFYVDHRVLIPRNDTEILVRETVKYLHQHPELTQGIYVDVGTGSGCIALSVLQEILPLKFTKSYGLDISSGALEVAKKNSETYPGVSCTFFKSDLLEKIFTEHGCDKKSLYITANLPYIKNGDYENMSRQVRDYEPNLALFGGEKTGFELYEMLIKQCFQLKHIFLSSEIHLFIEIGFDQYEYSKNFLGDFGLGFEYFQDSASIERVIHISGF